MAEEVALVLYDSVLFNRTGHVGRWAESTNRGFTENAQRAAPVRSGELREGIHGEAYRTGTKHWEVVIHSDAPHSLYVLKGTTGPIMSNRMWGFRNNPATASAPYGLPRGGRDLDGRPNMRWLHANGYALKLRPGNGFPTMYKLKVRGQEANNFFAVAADKTAIRHPSLRGFNPGFGY